MQFLYTAVILIVVYFTGMATLPVYRYFKSLKP